MIGDLFSNELFERRIDLPNAELNLIEKFFAPKMAVELFEHLKELIPWSQDRITIYGKTHDVPRLSAWYGDEGVRYSYSNINLTADGWIPILKDIKGKIEDNTHHQFNSCLLNYYKDGSHSMGWHQDNEPELGRNPVIASLSLGATRNFQLKHITDKSINSLSLPLKQGTLLIMEGSTQHYWKHQVPKTKQQVGERINLTFRMIH